MGLLGQALAVKSGTSYKALVRKRICEPLGMTDTWIALDKPRQDRMAEGHDCDGDAVPNWTWEQPTLAGAGGIRSTVDDMLTFLAANLGFTKTGFDPAIADSHAVRFKDAGAGNDIGLAWHIRGKDQVIWHNGQTGGYHSYAAISPRNRVGVVVLANTASMHVDAVGNGILELMQGGKPEPPTFLTAVKLPAETLDKLVGRYKLGPLHTARVTREVDQLIVQLTGQPKVKFYAESDSTFFCRVVDAAITFDNDDEGRISQLVIHQNGQDVPAPREK